VRQAAENVENLPQMWSAIEMELNQVGRRLAVLLGHMPGRVTADWTALASSVQQYIGNMIGNLSSPTVEWVGRFAKNVPGFLVSLVMALLSSYFFVAERNHVNEWYRSHAPAYIVEKTLLIRQSLSKSVGGYFKAQLKIEIWMYLLLVVGLSVLRIDYVLLIALGIALLDFFPFFGTGTIMVPWAIIKILSGDYNIAIGLLIIWGVGQLARQIIQPKIVGDSMGVPPIPTLFLLYFGYKVAGVLGMIAAVPLGIMFYSLYKEGVFDTTRNSLLILVAGVNRFRKLKPRDLEEVTDMLEEKRKEK